MASRIPIPRCTPVRCPWWSTPTWTRCWASSARSSLRTRARNPHSVERGARRPHEEVLDGDTHVVFREGGRVFRGRVEPETLGSLAVETRDTGTGIGARDPRERDDVVRREVLTLEHLSPSQRVGLGPVRREIDDGRANGGRREEFSRGAARLGRGRAPGHLGVPGDRAELELVSTRDRVDENHAVT